MKKAKPKYTVGLRVWYYANFNRCEGNIAEIQIKPKGIFYRVGTDWVPQELLLPVGEK